MRSGELVPDVISALESSGLPASRLIVEITESVLLDDSHVLEDLTVLRQLGVRIAIDDFGTGWSSLAYLVGMPVDVLKMDQYFLANVEHDPARRAMCRAVLQLGSSLGLPVIVEGVTNPAVLDAAPGHGPPLSAGLRLLPPARGRAARRRRVGGLGRTSCVGSGHRRPMHLHNPGDAVMTALRSIPRAVRWTVPLALLGLALTVPFSAPDGTGMQWDELVLAAVAGQLRLGPVPDRPAGWTVRPPVRGRCMGVGALAFMAAQCWPPVFPGPEFDGFGVDDVLLFAGRLLPAGHLRAARPPGQPHPLAGPARRRR